MERESNESIFRKKSIDKISSPEQLHDYIKVSSPGAWFILIAIIILLFGAIFWGIFGKITINVENNEQKTIAPIKLLIE